MGEEEVAVLARRNRPAGAVAAGVCPRAVRLLLAVGMLAMGWVLVLAPAAVGQAPTVLVLRVDGAITPLVAGQLADGVRTAERDGHVALLVELDTPGGLDTSMREIAQAFLNARVPVLVYVAPSGARAASAGAIITFSAHVAAMAPGTTIGAATPVDLQGGEISDKVVNDAAAFAEAVARQRGRNPTFAVDTVRKGRAVTADQALRLEAVDLIAADRAALLRAIDSRRVTAGPGTAVILHTAGAQTVEHQQPPTRKLLGWLADPNLAFVFLSIGALAVVYELASPGMGLGGVIGAALLVLGFVSLSVLPVNLAGLLLLGLAVALFVAELFAPGIGVFAGGGTIALLLAGVLLFDGPVRVATPVLWPLAVVAGGGTVLAGRLAWRARRAPSATGAGALIGRRAVIHHVDDTGGTGRVRLDGTWWRTRPRGGGPLTPAQPVRIVAMDGLDLVVEPCPARPPHHPDTTLQGDT
ncbi:MAG TPA: nodulation protein NfeD [Actinomycetota bacterium]|nr:nodulation protein NfeD [Actinomycetota bacterium]